MKNRFLTIALTVLTLTAVTSQEKIQFGVKGGINFTSMSGDFLSDKEYKTGFHIGGLVEIPFSSKISLQPELLYSTHGVKGKEYLFFIPTPDGPFPDPVTVDVNLSYIQIPVLVKFYFSDFFSLEIGSSFNFLINEEIDFLYSDDTVIVNPRSNDVGETFELGGIVGFSYKIQSSFFVNLRYYQGLTNAFSVDSMDSKNKGFLLGVGYMFN